MSVWPRKVLITNIKMHRDDKFPISINCCWLAEPHKAADLLLITWTVTLATEPTEAWQAYWPLSLRVACLTSREEVVSEPASVIWLTPPRLELWEMG